MDASATNLRRRLTFAAAVFVGLTACAYLGLVLAVDWILERASNACSSCVDEHRWGDTLPCAEHRSDFTLARLVPWRNDETDLRLSRCLTAVHEPALLRATTIKPDRQARDGVLAQIDVPSDLQLYLAGAFDRLIERGGEYLLIDEALQMHDLDLVQRAALLPTEEAMGRRAAWLCLLADDDRGLDPMREWVERNEHAVPDQYPTGWLAPLGLYACSGEEVDGSLWTVEPMRLLRIERHEREAIDVLESDHRWSARARRFALSYALDRGEPITLDVFEWLRGAASSEDRSCHFGMLDEPLVPVLPHAALHAADRLLAWTEDARDEILDLQRRLPARMELVDDEEEQTYARIPPRLIDYVRRVARDLRWDAGEALFAQGLLDEGVEAFEAAVAIGAHRCAITRWLAGLEPLGNEPSDLPERVVWLDGHARDTDAFAAMEQPHAQWGEWFRAALGARVGEEAADVVSEFDPAGAWWHAVHTGETFAMQREAAERAYHDALRPTSRPYGVSALVHAARFELTARAVEGRDVDLFHTTLFPRSTSRSALWARAYAARQRGDDESTAEHRLFYERVGGLANGPNNALLLRMALDDWSDPHTGSELAGDPTAEPPWDRPVFGPNACPRRVWSHFPGTPARDDGELAFRHLERDRLAREGIGATYVVRAQVSSARIEEGMVRASIRSSTSCAPGPSSRSGYDPYDQADEAIDDEPASFWERHALPDGDHVFATWRAAHAARAHGVWVWEVEPTTIEAEVSEALRAQFEDLGRPQVELVIRVIGAHYDRRTGPRLDAEIVEARMGSASDWVRASPTRTPQSRGED